MAPATRQIDNLIEIITPENIAFHYRLAGPFRRLAAYLLDLAVRVGMVVTAALLLTLAFGSVGFGGLGIGGALLLYFGLEWFYGGLFETFWNGQTPGKRALRLRVLGVDGQPINGLQAIGRNLLRPADAVPLVASVVPTYLLGLLSTVITGRFQRLGDLAAGTMVVIDQPQNIYGITQIKEAEAIRLAAYLPLDFEPSHSLGRALSAYVQRRATFPPNRRAEIAAHLGEPLRARFGLPRGTSHDLLLCALYYRTFIADRPQQPESSPRRPAARPPLPPQSATTGAALLPSDASSTASSA